MPQSAPGRRAQPPRDETGGSSDDDTWELDVPGPATVRMPRSVTAVLIELNAKKGRGRRAKAWQTRRERRQPSTRAKNAPIGRRRASVAALVPAFALASLEACDKARHDPVRVRCVDDSRRRRRGLALRRGRRDRQERRTPTHPQAGRCELRRVRERLARLARERRWREASRLSP